MQRKNSKPTRILIGERVVIYPRGKRGIYQADFHCDGHRRVSLGTANLRAAKRKAIEIEFRLLNSTYCSISKQEKERKVRMTFAEAIKAFIEFQETEGNRRKTIVRYRGILERFAEFMGTLEVRKLEKVTLPAFDKYRAFRKPKLSPKTMHHEGRIIKQFFAWCAKRGHISENPLATCKFSPPKASTKNVLSLEQVNAILLAATSYRHPVLSVLAFTGMRSGECRNLRTEDVDLKQDWIYIRSRPGFETKTNEERKVPIHPRLKFILSRLKPKKSGWYFSAVPSPKHPQGGNFISTKHLNEDFLVLLKRLEIPAGREESGFTIHSLRHFFKTFCITHGVGKPIVDTWQGHSLGKDPSNDYFHLSDEDSQRLMKGVPFGKEPGQKD